MTKIVQREDGARGKRGSEDGVRFRIFDTAMGWTWIAARAERIRKIELPQPTRAAALASLRRFDPDAVEDQSLLPKVVKDLVAYFEGKKVRFNAPLAIDECSPFLQRVYVELMALAPGEVISYGELAKRIGSPGAARSVGTALSRNPFPPVVPCHRVVTATGGLGGFSAAGGLSQKVRLLELEGAEIGAGWKCPADGEPTKAR